MNLSHEPESPGPSASARAALDAYRSALRGPEGIAEANLRATLARLEAGDPGPLADDAVAEVDEVDAGGEDDGADPRDDLDEGEDEAAPMVIPGRPRWPIVVGVLAIAAALLLLIGGPPRVAGVHLRREDPAAASDQRERDEAGRARLRGGGDRRGPAPAVVADAPVATADPAGDGATVVEDAGASATTDPDASPPPGREGAARPSIPGRGATAPSRSAPASAGADPIGSSVEVDADADALRRESALVRRIRRALGEGDHAGALALVADHRRQFPAGALAEDRDAFEAIALCRLDRLREGRGRARALLAAQPRSLHADGLREACDLAP